MRRTVPVDDQPSYSQFGEDRLLSTKFANTKSGVFVEIGAYNGIDMSNTFHFETIGWSGVLVEAVPSLAEQCRKNRPGSTTVNAAIVGPLDRGIATIEIVTGSEFLSHVARPDSAYNPLTEDSQITEARVQALTMDDVLGSANLSQIDFVTIDVEGGEWGVLQGFSIGRWNPRFVLLERNGYRFDDRIQRYMRLHGYLMVRRTGVNDWYEYAPNRFRTRSVLWFKARWSLPTYLRRVRDRVREFRRT